MFIHSFAQHIVQCVCVLRQVMMKGVMYVYTVYLLTVFLEIASLLSVLDET